ncbi:MAG: hypothetical protein JNL41_01720 [Phenylobacterium sp.]|uniref:hypothetical protein n=1 Tax=Phenylobacterium sp. TaxID=1871053 RepID=UPI001A57AA8F|nr:hypothetical protein [Phenylobacterium sp.]MBL8552966.1 hypothetical protein [Phenylobacterium sp.]
MFTKVVTSLALVFSSASVVAFSPVQAQAQPRPFTQCVKNVFGTGIVAKVRWYDPRKVELIPGAKTDDPQTPADETIGELKPIGGQRIQPIREENIAVGEQSCFFGFAGAQPKHFAIVSVVGGEYLNEAVTIAAGTVVGVVGGVACALTAGTTCPAVAAAVGGAVSAVGMALPDAKAVFYVGTPGGEAPEGVVSSVLEVSGTAWSPAAFDSTLGVAQAIYRANIDFCHSDLSDTATGDNITVEFLANGTPVGRQVIKGNTSDCGALSRGYLETAIATTKIVSAIRVSTSGGDAMYVDQARLFRNGKVIVWDGRNNGGGWCLSTDPNDYKGGWENNVVGACQRTYTFASPAN